jgi:hypothetical protein
MKRRSKQLALFAVITCCGLMLAACGGGGSSSTSIGGGGGTGGGNGGAPSSGQAIPASFFGMTTLQPSDYPAVPVGTLGHPPNFAWGWIEQTKGNFDFSLFDQFANDAQQHGIPMVLTFGWTPGWAVADPTTCAVKYGLTLCTGPPANIQDWKDFVTAVINHYNGTTAPHIKYYELWNEANGHFWSGTAQDMVNLAQAAYPIIHKDPTSELLTPSTVGDATSPLSDAPSWLVSFLQGGGSQYADGGTFHAYLANYHVGLNPYPYPDQDTTAACSGAAVQDCHGSIITMVQTYRTVLNSNGLSGKPIFDTEGSWGCPGITDPTQQSAWIARFYILGASLMVADNFQGADWYAWGGGNQDECGVIESSPGVPNQPGIAYQQVYNWIVGSAFTQTPGCSAQGQVWSCQLTLPNGKPGLIVWNQTGSSSYIPPSQYTEYRDLAGNLISITSGESVTITVEPILFDEGSI